MRKTFAGHFKLSKIQQIDLWKQGKIVFDANVLLHLYRYSDQTRSDLLSTMEKLSERIWIPHRVSQEYLRRRLDVICQQQKAYNDAIVDLNKIEETLKNQRHPFVSAPTFESIRSVLEKAKNELGESMAAHAKRLANDELLEKIADLFDGRVGPPYSEDEVKKLCVEGEKRYAAKMPPGYKDQNKDLDGDPTRPYGDFFIWEQILGMASQKKCGVILVTDDSKEDWWLNVNGKTIGSRPELIQEFQERCGTHISILSTYRFMEEAGVHLKSKHHEGTVNEMKILRQDDRERDVSATNHIDKNYGTEDVRTKLDKARMAIQRYSELQKHLLAEEHLLDQIRSEFPRHEYKLQDVRLDELRATVAFREARLSSLRSELAISRKQLEALGAPLP